MTNIKQTEAEAAFEVVKNYTKYINDTPALLSILYDIDLMPEQIQTMVNAKRMVAFCLIFKKLTKRQIDKLFEE